MIHGVSPFWKPLWGSTLQNLIAFQSLCVPLQTWLSIHRFRFVHYYHNVWYSIYRYYNNNIRIYIYITYVTYVCIYIYIRLYIHIYTHRFTLMWWWSHEVVRPSVFGTKFQVVIAVAVAGVKCLDLWGCLTLGNGMGHGKNGLDMPWKAQILGVSLCDFTLTNSGQRSSIGLSAASSDWVHALYVCLFEGRWGVRVEKLIFGKP